MSSSNLIKCTRFYTSEIPCLHNFYVKIKGQSLWLLFLNSNPLHSLVSWLQSIQAFVVVFFFNLNFIQFAARNCWSLFVWSSGRRDPGSPCSGSSELQPLDQPWDGPRVFWGCLHYVAFRISLPWPRTEPRPWQWKFWILTTGSPGNRLYLFLFLKIFFLTWTIFFKSLLNLLQYYFCCFYVLDFWPWGKYDLSSLTRDQTCTPYIGRWSLNHWPAREIPLLFFFDNY